MHEGIYNTTADRGKHFVLTGKGHARTPDRVKPERRAGEPVRGFEYSVPASWLRNGWVEERGIQAREG